MAEASGPAPQGVNGGGAAQGTETEATRRAQLAAQTAERERDAAQAEARRADEARQRAEAEARAAQDRPTVRGGHEHDSSARGGMRIGFWSALAGFILVALVIYFMTLGSPILLKVYGVMAGTTPDQARVSQAATGQPPQPPAQPPAQPPTPPSKAAPPAVSDKPCNECTAVAVKCDYPKGLTLTRWVRTDDPSVIKTVEERLRKEICPKPPKAKRASYVPPRYHPPRYVAPPPPPPPRQSKAPPLEAPPCIPRDS